MIPPVTKAGNVRFCWFKWEFISKRNNENGVKVMIVKAADTKLGKHWTGSRRHSEISAQIFKKLSSPTFSIKTNMNDVCRHPAFCSEVPSIVNKRTCTIAVCLCSVQRFQIRDALATFFSHFFVFKLSEIGCSDYSSKSC